MSLRQTWLSFLFWFCSAIIANCVVWEEISKCKRRITTSYLSMKHQKTASDIPEDVLRSAIMDTFGTECIQKAIWGVCPATATQCDLENQRLDSFIVKGISLGGNSVRLLSLNDNHLSSLENLILPPSLEGLHLAHNKITSIDLQRKNISELHLLRWLSLESNLLTDLTNVSLPHSLHRLDLTANQITHLGGSLRNLPNLQLVHLNNNRLGMAQLRSTDLPRSVKTLWLNDNGITDAFLSSAMLSDLPNLETVNLNHNRLINFNGVTFPQSLKILYLAYNPITDLSPANLTDLRSLEQLFLAENQLRSLTDLGFRRGQRHPLKRLYLNENYISDLKADFLQSTFPALTRLYLKRNRITDLRGVVFPQSLRHLYLANNSLSDLNGTRFAELASLTKLDLSFNNIGSVDLELGGVLFPQSLTRLRLNGNLNILSLERVQLPRSLEHLDLIGTQVSLSEIMNLKLKWATLYGAVLKVAV